METKILKMNAWRTAVRRQLRNDARHPEGWSISPVDASKALHALPHLCMADGWQLITFQYMCGGDGNSVTFAVPKDRSEEARAWLGECIATGGGPFQFHRSGYGPPGSKASFMDAVIGDGSPESFTQASLLMREIGDIGAMGHGIGWGTCEILYRRWPTGIESAWELMDGCRLPADSTPIVIQEENLARCRFYTESEMGGWTISLFEDIYFGTSMRPETVHKLIAQNPNGGWIP
jgi:hypothetical protein